MSVLPIIDTINEIKNLDSIALPLYNTSRSFGSSSSNDKNSPDSQAHLCFQKSPQEKTAMKTNISKSNPININDTNINKTVSCLSGLDKSKIGSNVKKVSICLKNVENVSRIMQEVSKLKTIEKKNKSEDYCSGRLLTNTFNYLSQVPSPTPHQDSFNIGIKDNKFNDVRFESNCTQNADEEFNIRNSNNSNDKRCERRGTQRAKHTIKLYCNFPIFKMWGEDNDSQLNETIDIWDNIQRKKSKKKTTVKELSTRNFIDTKYRNFDNINTTYPPLTDKLKEYLCEPLKFTFKSPNKLYQSFKSCKVNPDGLQAKKLSLKLLKKNRVYEEDKVIYPRYDNKKNSNAKEFAKKFIESLKFEKNKSKSASDQMKKDQGLRFNVDNKFDIKDTKDKDNKHISEPLTKQNILSKLGGSFDSRRKVSTNTNITLENLDKLDKDEDDGFSSNQQDLLDGYVNNVKRKELNISEQKSSSTKKIVHLIISPNKFEDIDQANNENNENAEPHIIIHKKLFTKRYQIKKANIKKLYFDETKTSEIHLYDANMSLDAQSKSKNQGYQVPPINDSNNFHLNFNNIGITSIDYSQLQNIQSIESERDYNKSIDFYMNLVNCKSTRSKIILT